MQQGLMARQLGRDLPKLLLRGQKQQSLFLASQIGREFAVCPAEAAVQSRLQEPAKGGLSSSSGKLLLAAGGIALLGIAQLDLSIPVAHAEAEAQATGAAAAPDAQVDELAKYRRQSKQHGRPKEIILYQYEVCPFCNKVRAFLDYYQVPYRVVEVNPLTKKQLKWTSHKKVPVVLIDNELVDDSSLILSRLAVEFEQQAEAPKGWFSKASKASNFNEEEEIRWRRWVDKRFVQVITVNIYRNMRESWQTFDYITEHGNFNFAERQAARVAGSGLMWGISGKLIKKYGIEGDLRANLFNDAKEWVEAVGQNRPFMGGDKPNLADLSMFGVIRSVTGTDTFMDLMHKTEISLWYERMMSAVGTSSRLPN